jgi:hypothetical protein
MANIDKLRIIIREELKKLSVRNRINEYVDKDINEYDEYLGDGVYISYDGYSVWLAVNHHRNKVIALEPEVIDDLIKYLKRHKFIR